MGGAGNAAVSKASIDRAVYGMKRVIDNVERIIVGKRYAIELIMATLACRGHILIEDVPGVGKTSLASALARSVNGTFTRVQFTPDIMPSDITGFSAYNPKTGDFEFRPGAVMSQFVLADEINRTSPKTQSSLLEVMEENQVTVDGQTYAVPVPFIVLATQNPVEYLGTYPLPEAQLDRFFMKISMGYPDAADEGRMLERFKAGDPLRALEPVTSGEEITYIQDVAERIYINAEMNSYIVNIVRQTRTHDAVVLGASPRASLCLYKASQAWALYCGRDFVIPDDIMQMAPHVLEHRIMLKQEAKLRHVSPVDVIRSVLNKSRTEV